MPLALDFPLEFGGDGDTDTKYHQMLLDLMPPGIPWGVDTPVTSNMLLALSDELNRVDVRIATLVEESDPRTADETIENWESMLGLPDATIPTLPGPLALRQLAVTQKYVKRGGQTPAFYVALAASCGYSVTITDGFCSQVLRAGFHAGDYCWGLDRAYFWQVTVSAPSGAALTHDQLEAVIRQSAPAHTTVGFVYL